MELFKDDGVAWFCHIRAPKSARGWPIRRRPQQTHAFRHRAARMPQSSPLASSGARILLAGCLAVAGVLGSTPVFSDVFVLVHDERELHLSDRQPDARFVLLLRVLEERGRSAKAAACQMKGVRDDDIQAAAADNRLDVALLYAVIEIESACNTRAVSRKGAMGLMQLMPATARRYGVTDPHDAGQNIRAGSRHLRYLLTLFRNDTALALAAYNAGEGAVAAHGRKIPPFPETQKYVPAVLARYAALQP